MGKSWDSSGIAFDTEMWADLLRILKPGGHLLAFSGSRTYHRMAVAIEDAGFEIRDMIEWVYGSGFPISLNIGKAVDKTLGAEREVIATGFAYGMSKGQADSGYRPADYESKQLSNEAITPEAELWNGYGTALKPAHEPCVLARKPIEGTVANNVLKHGTGGLNIDGTRVGTEARYNAFAGNTQGYTQGDDRSEKGSGFWKQKTEGGSETTGRFPANLIHDGSDEVVELFPDTGKSAVRNGGSGGSGLYKGSFGDGAVGGYTDSGSASRFFYTAKASKSERNAGLEGFEAVNVLGYEFDPDNPYKSGKMNNSNIHQLTIARTGKPPQPQKNHHPTVKPLSLTKYLATLIKPPTGGRLLVPFSGSGSEMIGALQSGWEYVEGVELTEEYIPIAEARIKYWLEKENTKQETLF